ncbi:TPA: CBS domain-containing protein [Candidatus Berkelbacteria bacterium]|uniref:Putative CBS domain-containing signal transduction protein n=1 Tax=Berkelbacteria bacterium GW2011_GWE1_39_12 TaxID=1618337 RepID=A0A0G4B5P6_9BACT|nr:MAG: putative CBS domain-containing signal transduction protein [Berkelbacteria bacterium GW2011_GWE1_39_12]HBO60917.1 CBS domain-containing protein [Candidatus Berkelbacteria bacterium]
MTAKDLMGKIPACLTGTDKIVDAARLMKERGIGSIAIVASLDRLEIIGIITDRDIVNAVADGICGDSQISAIMSGVAPFAIVECDDIITIINMFISSQVRCLPVVDENRCVVGVISIYDICDYFIR